MTCRAAINQATDEPERPCAWCLAERHEPANPEDSHGICEHHMRQEMAKLAEKEVLDVVGALRLYVDPSACDPMVTRKWREHLAQRLEIVLKRVRRMGGTHP